MSAAGFRLIVRRTAALEIAEQAKYYRLQATAALAMRWRTAVNDAIQSLQTFPERGSPIELRGSPIELNDERLKDIRRLPIQGFPKHLIFYHVNLPEKTVTILHMLHGARDISSAFRYGESR